MKASLLKLLRENNGYISGEMLGKELGISRVSVWKHIMSLRQAGFVISASSHGYRLIESPDALLGCEFPQLESKIHHFDTVKSTMDIARDFADKGTEPGTIVVSEIQSGGRGRLGREWSSPSGGIYFTVILRPDISPLYAPRLNLMTSVAVAKTFKRLLGVQVELKWPNDVLIYGKKVCGILAEMRAELDQIKYVNIGIGINVNNSILEYTDKAIALKDIKGRDISRKELFHEVVGEILKQQKSIQSGAILNEWRHYSATLNKKVSISGFGGEITGTAVDIESNGALIVKTQDGTTTTVIAGDCLHI